MKKFRILCLMVAFGLMVACNTKTLAVVLDGLAIACDVAAPFAGPYASYVLLAADVAQASATELSSADPTPVQLDKILAALENAAAQTPDLTNADAQTKAKIQAVEAALQAVIHLVEQQMAKQPTAATARAVTLPPALSQSDQDALKDVALHVSHVQLLLGK